MKRITRILCTVLALLLVLTAPALAFEELSKGSKGDAVVELQNKLNELGYSVGTVDGDFGGKTEKAIKQFQKDKGLKETGVLDEETYNALFNGDEMFDIFPFSVGRLIVLTADGIATMLEEDKSELYYETIGKDVVSIIKDGGEYPMLLHSDGSLSLACECDFKLNDEWKDLILAGASSTHAVGLKKDGTWIVAGENESGQCNVCKWTDIVQIQVADHYTIGLKSDGTVVSAGDIGEIDVSHWTDRYIGGIWNGYERMAEQGKRESGFSGREWSCI